MNEMACVKKVHANVETATQPENVYSSKIGVIEKKTRQKMNQKNKITTTTKNIA